MYLLDTNVVSELRKAKTGKINRGVKVWARNISPVTLFFIHLDS
jgi:predicted nucleic acid-binding protein